MPLTGDLADFHLPEVLILIGQRSGRLQLAEVPYFGRLELDLDQGHVQAMYVERETLVEVEHMVANLSAVVQMKKCLFQFTPQSVPTVARETPVTITQLVLLLVCYVDEQVARQKEIDQIQKTPRTIEQDIARKASDGLWAAKVAQKMRTLTDRLPRLPPTRPPQP